MFLVLDGAMVFSLSGLSFSNHAVFIEMTDGLLPIDCIKVEL